MFFINQRRNYTPADFGRKINVEQSFTCKLPSVGGALQGSARSAFSRTACQPQFHWPATASSVWPAQTLRFICIIGRIGTIFGPVVGALVLVGVSEALAKGAI